MGELWKGRLGFTGELYRGRGFYTYTGVGVGHPKRNSETPWVRVHVHARTNFSVCPRAHATPCSQAHCEGQPPPCIDDIRNTNANVNPHHSQAYCE